MDKIYVVVGYVHYEGSEMIKAFRSKDAAKAFQHACEEYQKTKHDMSDLDSWIERHPAGYQGYAVDGFSTKTLDMVNE